MTLRCKLLAVLALLVSLGPASAQAPPTRIRGTITAFDGTTLAVTSHEGQALRITVTNPLTVSSFKRIALTEIVPGSYVGTTARPGPDGELQAIEVRVFPESARGAGEGHRPWDLTPDSTMTNANVEAAVQDNSGRELTLAYNGGSVKVRVPADVPVLVPSPASAADLKPGAAVFVTATRAADGSLSTARITVSKDGVAPPM